MPTAGCAVLAWTVNVLGRNITLLNLCSNRKPLGDIKAFLEMVLTN